MPHEDGDAESGAPYQKAHRNLSVATAALLAFELIGLEPGPDFLGSYHLSLNSPNAFPLVLSAFVVHAGFRCFIEWQVSAGDRRTQRLGQLDFYVAMGLAVLALLVLAVQTTFRLHVADYFDGGVVYMPALAFVVFSVFHFSYAFAHGWSRRQISIASVPVSLGVAALFVILSVRYGASAETAIRDSIVSVPLAALACYLLPVRPHVSPEV